MHRLPPRTALRAPTLASACALACAAVPAAGAGASGSAGDVPGGVPGAASATLATASPAPETRARGPRPDGAPGPVVVQGDVLVEAAPAGGALAPRGIGYARDRTWADGVVPVWLDPALDAATVASIERAIAVWNEAAGVSVRRVETALPPAGDHVRFQPGEGCASWVGRRGGAQELWVAPDCTTGSIVHELGHALGLEHEHVRPDRDQWIEILWENVIEEKRHNFDVAGGALETLGDYDYASIMHYGPDFFSRDGAPTIRPLVGTPRIGQREAPSAGDVAAIAAVYGTDLALAGTLAPGPAAASGPADGTGEGDGGEGPAGGAALELALSVTNAGARGAHGLELALPPGLVVRSATSADAWTCETPEAADAVARSAAPRCRLERLGAGARSSLALSVRRVGPGTAPVEVSVDAVNDDPDPSNDRATLSDPGTAAAPLLDDARPTARPGSADAEAAPDAVAARSPFELLSLAPELAASRPVVPGRSAPVPLTTIVARPGPEGDGAGDGEGRLERLFGGAAGAPLALVAGLGAWARRREARGARSRRA